MIPLLAAAILFLAIAIGAASRASGTSLPPAPPPLAEEPNPSDLALDDPVAALLQFGTPADAERLAEQGVDLAALGYRPPDP